jgi:hypothetical protein
MEKIKRNGSEGGDRIYRLIALFTGAEQAALVHLSGVIPSLFVGDGQNALHHAVGFESGIDRRTLEKLDQCLR